MPGKFSTDNIKEVGKDHYGEERRQVRLTACKALPQNPRILELYGSGGNMTTFYRQSCQNPTIVGVDKAPGTDYCMDNEKFVEGILPTLEAFNLVDFDAYGSPNPLIWKALASIAYPNPPIKLLSEFIIVSTDGLGLAMKQNPRINWSDNYKESPEVIDILMNAPSNIWRHVGRVNTRRRMKHFWGFADSIDGSGFSKYPSRVDLFEKQELIYLKNGIMN